MAFTRENFLPEAIVVGAKSWNLTPKDPRIWSFQYIIQSMYR